jgi:hypothetical protein
MYEKANADVLKYGGLPTPEEWAKKTESERTFATMNKIVPRTPAIEEALRAAKTMRDSLGAKLYGPSYLKLRELEDKSGVNETPITLEQLKKSAEGTRATSTSFLPDFMKMFSDQAILGGLAGAVQNPVSAEEHPITKYLRSGGDL